MNDYVYVLEIDDIVFDGLVIPNCKINQLVNGTFDDSVEYLIIHLN